MYDDIAADSSVGADERDLAKIRAAGLLLETASYPNMVQRLEPPAAPGATFRHTARELLALSAWRANDTAAARQVAGRDRQRRRDAAKPAFARRSAAGPASAGREELSRAGKARTLSEKSTMRRSQRLIAAAVLIALSGALAGCSSGMSNWDPSDLLDFLDTKKKLPGERKPVFPEGVPGLEQGVPKELYKGAARSSSTSRTPPPRPLPPPLRGGAEIETRREVQGQDQAAGCGRHSARARPPRTGCRGRTRGRWQHRRCAAGAQAEAASSASAPPRRLPISRRRNRRPANRRRPRNSRNSRRRHSRRRFPAARSRADLQLVAFAS